MKTITSAVVAITALLIPSFASAGNYLGGGYGAVGCGNYLCWLGGLVLFTINSVLVPVLFAIAFLMFLWGIAKSYIIHGDTPAEVEKGHKLVMWGIIGFAVMISVWGLVNVVANTFGLEGYYAPILPSSPTYTTPY